MLEPISTITDAASSERARLLYERAYEAFGAIVPTKEGEFRAHMAVTLVNDGPVTILLDSKKCFQRGYKAAILRIVYLQVS
ncbi:MAG TPA: D-aminoacyl-tRNA deacylase [Candidatus Aquicultor sp.]